MVKTIEETLIDNHEILYKVAMKYLRNHDDVLDALQETAYKSIKNSKKIRNKEYTLTWITRILINNCLQTLKKKKRFEAVEFNEGACFANQIEVEPLIEIEVSELLLKLKTNYRDVITMKYIEGYKIKEIAEIYNKPESTVKTWLRRGMAILKSEVDI
jgi:RNA polymerase sigma-70 factor (ECF subfamily)